MRPYLQSILVVLATYNILLRLGQWETLPQPSHEPHQGRVRPILGHSYYATPIACDNNPRNIIELDPDSDDQDFYILGPESII